MTIQDASLCTVAGKLSAGGLCAHLTNSSTHLLTFKETIDFLESQQARTCVPVPGFNVCADDQTQGVPVQLPARGAAIFMSAQDFNTLKTELEQLCRERGKQCLIPRTP